MPHLRVVCGLIRSQHYPAFFQKEAGQSSGNLPARDTAHGSESSTEVVPRVRFADVGCGFGGLLVKLSPLYPDTLMLGMELRDKVHTCLHQIFHLLAKASQCHEHCWLMVCN